VPPRFAYWTILIDNAPTAFRARAREELLPTLAQLKRTNPDVVLKWFARGRLWDSQEAERESWRSNAAKPRDERRGRDWRPGGDHKDPRARFAQKKRHKPNERHRSPGAGHERPQGTGHERDTRPHHNRPWRDKPAATGQPFNKRAASKPWSDRRGPDKPRTDKRGSDKPRDGKPSFGRPPSGKPAFGKPKFSKPPFGKAFGKPHGGQGPWRDDARGQSAGHRPRPHARPDRRDERPGQRETETPPKRRPEDTSEPPPAPERIGTKPEPPERG
jgi:hypothetical protein